MLRLLTTLPLLSILASTALAAERPKVSFEQSATAVDAYDFVEVAVRVEKPTAANPFLDAAVSGS
ncbi:MAG: hypothetical protein KJZ87_26765, partial [Thermoguttaceae bacterium]|nr:hypothetical protein [Thermoguttaceae bacterium]